MSVKVQALELAGLGYNPFRPDVGIFCGGFQGPLYPNPTALLLEGLPSFDPVEFQDVIPTIYKLNQYVGLGQGVPGIKIRNPGHFFGIMDTFYRMSYGLKVLDTLRKAETDVSDPIIDIIIPLILLQTVGESIERIDTEFKISELYPKLTEIPSDYIASFDVDNPIHTPVSNLDETMFNILKDVTIKEGYINLVATLRVALQNLQTEAEKFETRKHYFITTPVSIINRDPLFHPLSQFETFTLGAPCPQTLVNDTVPGRGTYLSQHKSISVNKAVELINQDGEFHGEIDPQVGQLDYRSITELNGVTNLLPVQIHARSDDFIGNLVDFLSCSATAPPGSRLVRSWVMVSLNLNITAQIESSITITGKMNLDVNNYNITMWGASRGLEDVIAQNECVPDQFQSVLLGEERRAFIKHKIVTNIKATNDFTWDKVWFGLPDTSFEVSDEKLVESEKLETTFFHLIPLGFSTCPESRPAPQDLWEGKAQVTELTFNETVPLKVGCNNIIGEFIAGSIHYHSGNTRSAQDIPDVILPPDPTKPFQMKYEIINAELAVKDSKGNTIVEIPPFKFEPSFIPADDEDGNPLGDA